MLWGSTQTRESPNSSRKKQNFIGIRMIIQYAALNGKRNADDRCHLGGGLVLSPVVSSSEIKHIPLFRQGGGGN